MFAALTRVSIGATTTTVTTSTVLKELLVALEEGFIGDKVGRLIELVLRDAVQCRAVVRVVQQHRLSLWVILALLQVVTLCVVVEGGVHAGTWGLVVNQALSKLARATVIILLTR